LESNARSKVRSVRRWFQQKAPVRHIIVIIEMQFMDDLNFEGYTCPVPIRPTDTVILGHGSGGTLSRDLLNRLFLPELGKAAPRALDDSAVVAIDGQRYALTTDSHVVSPLFFPGGDIGRLAICGTVNDLAMIGATPVALTCGFMIEEGLSFDVLQRVVASMKEAAQEAGVYIAAGDTKVVQKGGVDQIFINTSGIGKISDGVNISGANAKEGDVVIISGTIGDHGIAVLSAREGLGFETTLESDVAPLNHLVQTMVAAGEIHVLRDPTRGGLATSLVEISEQSNVTIELNEKAMPYKSAVKAACEMLGFDPLYVANEGKLVAFVKESDAHKVLDVMKKTKYGENAVMVGKVIGTGKSQVRLKTAIGGTRLVDMLPGEMLPRIC
jgi:hydrogenase expression/formation protein HypE